MEEEPPAKSGKTKRHCKSCTKMQSRLERALRQLERQIAVDDEIRAENERLKQEIQSLKHRNVETTSAVTQTDSSTLSDNGRQLETSQADEQQNGDPELEAAATGAESGDQSVADMLREAANECISHNGYVYDEKSGLYYDYGSGYYYDPHRKLFYEPRSGTYYQYNEETREYSFHSRENPERLKRHCEQLWIQTGGQHAPPKRRSKRNQELVKAEGSDSDHKMTETVISEDAKSPSEGKQPSEKEDLEEGEISDESEVEETKHEVLVEDEAYEVEREIHTGEEIENYYAPCVRLMITESGNLTVGTLFIITCAGGTIGRPSKRYRHAVDLVDDGISECACQIDYDSTTGDYQLTMPGKGTEIHLNEKRLRKKDGAATIHHRDRLRIGGTEMGVHIHPGFETCDGCEPGVAQAQVKEVATEIVDLSTSREDQRREQMKRMKTKFGLRGAAFEPVRVKGRDRAAERRIEKGSENDFVSQSGVTRGGTSAHRHLPETNKGATLLAKMGWKPGQSLGKTGTDGIIEPVTAEVRLDPHAGFGSDLPSVSLDANPGQVTRIKNWKKMKERYERIPQSSPKVDE